MNSLQPARFFPNHAQLPLLEVCLLRDPDAARRAWKQWKERIDLDDLDPSCFRIMSLVYRRMVDLGIDDPDAGRLKGLYRYHWTRNQIAWRGKDRVVRRLGEMGIDTLLLKGAALSRTVYPEPATRGMHDLDVLVPVSSAVAAMELLQSEGWIAQHFDPVRTIPWFHGCSFLHPEFGELDLHWHVFRSCCSRERDAELWSAARPLVVDGMTTRVLCPADLFLHACEHGLHPSPASALQWLVDATLIIRHSPAPFHWARLMDQAHKYRLVLPVRRTLQFIQHHFEPAIPQQIIEDFLRLRVSPRDRLAYFLAGRPENENSWTRPVGVAAGHYLNATEGVPARERLRGFPLYFRLLRHEKREWPVVLKEEWRKFLAMRRDDVADLFFRVGRIFRLSSFPRGGLITRFPSDCFRGFYPVETELNRPFRWSQPEASLELVMPRKAHVVRLGLLPFRDLTLLFKDGLIVRINGVPIPATALQRKGRFLFCRVEATWLKRHGRQKLSWTIQPWTASGDSRPLGLPLSRLWFYRPFGSSAAT